ncbi:PREDICTED: disease resistance protein At4g27190-like isoform X3 [Populus euphratica]|uniref:Disease resistance protein At4g27190-like isoform X3 n=1 Tax=Populus euphratica TaxID=75702 RepID=A0AAJ6XCA0_POPEU|nr:PREDICTED: disease resistance protein At4g27190-like isoform X3 [Populus euphratica]
MKALKDDNVNMIGLYGMGGVGKTTLVKEVGRRAKESQLFPEVLMATVSQNPNVTDIQHQMVDKLDLGKEKSTNAGRADLLWLRLKKVEKMLIILDDVWKHIDLKEIGIPFGDDHRGCKILLTTRRRDICSYMVCQKNVFLGLFSEKESWDLFRINAGLDDGDSTLNRVARDVARECNGLPIALVTMGRALRGKSADEWNRVSNQLKKSKFPVLENIEEKNAYACLKLSYDYLKSKETKLCFLLCCLFPEDYNIPVEDLTRYAVGYGLHQDGEPIEDAREQVHVAIQDLKACCLLLGTETEEHVKMHDLVRDVAIQIASEEYGFMVKAGLGLEKWPWTGKRFEGCTTISLMGNKLAELPEGLECPRLKVLLLEVDDGLNVPERFFEGMKELEVLSLEGGCLSLQSLELSTKLQSLVLISCGCKDLIWLRKLQRLKILGLMGCLSIKELPDEIGELKELRLLDVTDCDRLSRIPVNLIGRLKKLEELLIGDCSFEGWVVDGCDSTGGMNASLKELNSLSQLAVLSLRIPKVECIPRDFVFPDSLRKYDIILANANEYYRKFRDRYPTSLILVGTSLNAKTFEQLFLHKLEFVEVRDCGDVSTLFPARLRQGLKNLKEVIVESCESLEEVFELDEADEGSSEEKELLSSLTTLGLRRLPELKCIWKGPTRHVSLQNLARLDLDSLDKLTFIFTPSLARSLPKLETLDIRDCGELKHVIREEDGEREIITESPCFPQLKNITIEKCGKLEYVFPVSVSPSLLNLEEMRIHKAHNVKHIFYSVEGDALTTDGIIKFPRLRELDLSFRSNCSFFVPNNFAAQLPSLQTLQINGHKEVGSLSAQLQGLTKLKTLRLQHVPDTRCIWKGTLEMAAHGQQNGSLQRLKFVLVEDCGDIRAPFPAKLLPDLNNLRKVEIKDCKSLEEVFELGDLPGEGSSEEKEMPLLSSLTTLELRRLPELKCIWKGPTRHVSLQNLARLDLYSLDKLTFIFTPSLAQSLSKLESLRISACGELKHIIREEDGEREIIPVSPGLDDQASPINVEKEIVLPNLKELWLGQLSSIVCFSFGWCDYFVFPRLEKLKVRQCPKMTTKFATTPDGSMSAQSDVVSEVAEYSSNYRKWTRNNGWKEEEDDDDDVGSEEEEEEEYGDDDDC